MATRRQRKRTRRQRRAAQAAPSPGFQPKTLAGKKKKKKKGKGLKIKKDLQKAQDLAEQFDLIPELSTVETERSQEIIDIINQRQEEFDLAAERDPEQQALLESLKGGLEGLTDEEKQRFRESADEGLDSTLATLQRQLAIEGSGRNIGGAAGQAGLLELAAQRLAAGRGVERDIGVTDVNVRDARKAQFADFLDNLISGEFARRQTALGALESTLRGAEADELSRQLINLGQERAQAGLRGSTLFGLVGLRGSRRAQKQARKLEEERFALEQEIAAQQQAALEQSIAQIKAQQTGGGGEGGSGI